jgi:predicted amidophosphoribosyltransferase
MNKECIICGYRPINQRFDYCPRCGENLSVNKKFICLNCGRDFREYMINQKYCGYCGVKIK